MFALFSCCEFLLRKKDMLWFPSTWSHISLQNKKITNTHTEPKLSLFVIWSTAFGNKYQLRIIKKTNQMGVQA